MRTAPARVNHGRWIVDCPAGDCLAALRVEGATGVCDCRDDNVCDHPEIPHDLAFAVERPADADEITRILDLRPTRPSRNWYPGETLAEVKAENVEHGVRV
jgi:hypothetical protein